MISKHLNVSLKFSPVLRASTGLMFLLNVEGYVGVKDCASLVQAPCKGVNFTLITLGCTQNTAKPRKNYPLAYNYIGFRFQE